jgi:hypothetical protein
MGTYTTRGHRSAGIPDLVDADDCAADRGGRTKQVCAQKANTRVAEANGGRTKNETSDATNHEVCGVRRRRVRRLSRFGAVGEPRPLSDNTIALGNQ